MKLYVSGRLYFLQNKPDLSWAMQSYEDTALKFYRKKMRFKIIFLNVDAGDAFQCMW